MLLGLAVFFYYFILYLFDVQLLGHVVQICVVC